ncbi:MAG: site-2 protease family protein [Patescibacteria group bacterium]
MQIESALLLVVVVMFSAVIHEVMHGYAADKLGDPTARYAGRLTLNPIPHIDFFGSIILPFITVFSTGFFFGWAKPVPYNPYNLTRAPYWGEAIVAVAGPASNLAIALFFGLIIRANVLPIANEIWFYVIAINISLMTLNLIPIPPLDGSKILSALLPRGLSRGYDQLRAQLEFNPLLGLGIVILFIMVLGGTFGSFVYSVARFLAGI